MEEKTEKKLDNIEKKIDKKVEEIKKELLKIILNNTLYIKT